MSGMNKFLDLYKELSGENADMAHGCINEYNLSMDFFRWYFNDPAGAIYWLTAARIGFYGHYGKTVYDAIIMDILECNIKLYQAIFNSCFNNSQEISLFHIDPYAADDAIELFNLAVSQKFINSIYGNSSDALNYMITNMEETITAVFLQDVLHMSNGQHTTRMAAALPLKKDDDTRSYGYPTSKYFENFFINENSILTDYIEGIGYEMLVIKCREYSQNLRMIDYFYKIFHKPDYSHIVRSILDFIKK